MNAATARLVELGSVAFSPRQLEEYAAMQELPFVALLPDGTTNMWAPARIKGREDPWQEVIAVAEVYATALIDHMRQFDKFDHGDMLNDIVNAMAHQGCINDDLAGEFLCAISRRLTCTHQR